MLNLETYFVEGEIKRLWIDLFYTSKGGKTSSTMRHSFHNYNIIHPESNSFEYVAVLGGDNRLVFFVPFTI
jgi:hypothetical protein